MTPVSGAAPGPRSFILKLRLAGFQAPQQLRVPSASSLADVQLVVAEHLGRSASAGEHGLVLLLRLLVPVPVLVLVLLLLLLLVLVLVLVLVLARRSHTCLGCAAGADIKLFVHDADFDEEVAVTDLEQLSGSGSFADCEILPKDASGALLGPQELAEGGA